MSDNLMTLAASAACVKAGLPRDQSLALTAAALVLDGPMAIAPALVAIERYRNRGNQGDQPKGGSTTVGKEQRAKSRERIGPALVRVPKVESLDRDEALERLTDQNLRATVTLNHSTADKMGKVLMQRPRQAAGVMVEEGTHVHLFVGAGPVEPEPPTEEEAIGEVKAKVGELKTDLDRRLERMERTINALAAANGKPAAA